MIVEEKSKQHIDDKNNEKAKIIETNVLFNNIFVIR